MTKKKKADEVEVEMIPRPGTPDFEYWLELQAKNAKAKKGKEEKKAKEEKKESKSKKQEKDK